MVEKVAGQDNLADILIKIVDNKTLSKHLASMGCVSETGRAESAPELIKQNIDILHIPVADYRYSEEWWEQHLTS